MEGWDSLPVWATTGKIPLAWNCDLAQERRQFQQPDLLPFFGRAQEVPCTDRLLQRRERMDNFPKYFPNFSDNNNCAWITLKLPILAGVAGFSGTEGPQEVV